MGGGDLSKALFGSFEYTICIIGDMLAIRLGICVGLSRVIIKKTLIF